MTTELVKYDFTETSGISLSDSSGNNNHAALHELSFDGSNWNSVSISDVNEVNWETPGGIGGPFGSSNSVKSYQFIINERKYFLHSSTVIPHSGANSKDFSLSMWVYPSANMDPSIASQNYMSVFGSNTDNTADGDFQISVKPDGGTNTLYIHCNGSYSHQIGTVTTNSWNNIVFTYDHNSGTNAELKTYLNGTTENTYSNTQISPNSTNGLQINAIKLGTNRNEDDGGKFFNGYISSTAIYDGVLVAGEVSLLYSTNEICYHENTKVLTKDGYKLIKNLKKGDLIKTYHNDYQPLSKLMKSMNVTQEFILFPKDSISEGIPNEDFMITRGHPIYYKDDYYLSENFLNDKIKIVKDISPYMYHLMFDSHEVIFTNNLTTTSLPNITSYYNLYLKEDEYVNKNKYNKDNIGKHYPPYMLHEDPLMIKELIF
jgi:hypothetical protein